MSLHRHSVRYRMQQATALLPHGAHSLRDDFDVRAAPLAAQWLGGASSRDGSLAPAAHLPVPTGSTVMAGPEPSETGTLMLTGRVWECVSLGGVTTRLVKVTPEPPESFDG